MFLITEYFHNEKTFIIGPLFTIIIIYFLLQLDFSFTANLFAFLVFIFISLRKIGIIKKGFLAKLF